MSTEPTWKNLLSDKCPLDRQPLVREERGFECTMKVAPYPHTCRFFITHKKHEELIAKMIKKPIASRV